jgi:SNF2 family DNA or RNA helicase
MSEINLFVKSLAEEISHALSTRMKFQSILRRFGYKNRNAEFLNRLNQALFENQILVYTRRTNLKNDNKFWDWFDVPKGAFIVFIHEDNYHLINKKNAIKMNTINEPIPSEDLFIRYASKAEEILICSAYVDLEMAKFLTELAKRYRFRVRFVADNEFNSSMYNKPLIRSQIETIGVFRTQSGRDEELGIMHLKLYVFYNQDGSISVFNSSANFTSNAWRYKNTESPITIQTGDKNDTNLMILVNAAENIWKQTENRSYMKKAINPGNRVSHPSFGVGEVFKIEGDNARVIFGTEVYVVRVIDLTLVSDPLKRLADGERSASDSLHRVKGKFLANYLFAQNRLTNEFYDFRIKPVPHQLLALKKAITSSRGGNLLFADDVGLGKTIEAGLVIQNLIRRIGEDKARVLIMCPAGLKWQWYEEMRDKFGLDFNIWKVHTTKGAEAFGSSTHGQRRLIASYHGMTHGEAEIAIERIIDSYDLVVIDECHRFSNDATQGWQLTRSMRDNNRVSQLLLLSATPHSGDRSRFLNLLHLLDKDEFPKGTNTNESLEKIASYPEIIEEFVYRNDKLSVSDFSGNPLFKNVITQTIEVELIEEEQAFCELVVEYIRALDAAKRGFDSSTQNQIGFVVSVYRKMLASSWKNVFRSMQARYKYLLNDYLEEEGLAPLFDEENVEMDEREEREIDNLIKQMRSRKIISNELEYLQRIIAAGKALEQKDVDTKIQKLIDVLYEPENSDHKFIIFTQYIKTLEVIKKALGGKEYTAEIQGSINIDDRKVQIEKFKNRVRFMICTEAGGEGINLQFASRVINFDMPWNPARLQQRIGRVWRYGQENEVVCYNFFVTNSISDQRVLENLSARIHEIVRTFLVPLEFNGVREELHEALIYDISMRVLGKAQEEESIESIIGILDDELREQRLRVAEKRIEEALKFVQLEQKDLAPTVGIQLEEIESFYAPVGINFLRLFAETIAHIFGGILLQHEEEVFEFLDLKLDGTDISSKLYRNKKYSFRQGISEDINREKVHFFGFGDDFFNYMLELFRGQESGGEVGYGKIVHPDLENEEAVALIISEANSVVVANEHPENYPLCGFIALPSGRLLNPEQVFNGNWLETNAMPLAIKNDFLKRTIDVFVEKQIEKLKAYRHRDFASVEPLIASAVGIVE